jgi:hypothetical protein
LAGAAVAETVGAAGAAVAETVGAAGAATAGVANKTATGYVELMSEVGDSDYFVNKKPEVAPGDEDAEVVPGDEDAGEHDFLFDLR